MYWVLLGSVGYACWMSKPMDFVFNPGERGRRRGCRRAGSVADVGGVVVGGVYSVAGPFRGARPHLLLLRQDRRRHPPRGSRRRCSRRRRRRCPRRRYRPLIKFLILLEKLNWTSLWSIWSIAYSSTLLIDTNNVFLFPFASAAAAEEQAASVALEDIMPRYWNFSFWNSVPTPTGSYR